MKYINQFGWKGYYPDLPADAIPDGGLTKPSKNFRVIDGVLKSKAGYSKMQTSALLGIPLLFYKHVKVDTTEVLIAFTTTDIYYWDDANTTFKMITELYNTGTVSVTESTADSGIYDTVTLADGTFDTSWDDNNTCYIGFDTDDPDAITTWYEVQSIDSTTQLTLKDTLSAGKTDVKYVLRKTYNAQLNRRWHCTSYYDAGEDENLLVATNGYDNPIKWTGTGRCTDLGGNPPKAKYIGQLGGNLIFGNVSSIPSGTTGTATPYTLIWSDTADAETWDGTGSSGYQELYETAGEIKIIAPFGDYLAIVKTDAIIIMWATGSADEPFNFKTIVRGQGAAFDTYGIVNQLLAIITKDDIVLFDGTPQLKSIAQGKIRRSFFEGLDYNKAYMVHSVYAPRYDEWRIYVPKLDANYPSETWVYRIKENEWCYDDVGFTGSGAYNYKTEITIGELDSEFGTIGDINVPIGSLSSARAYDDVITGDEDGYVYLETPGLKTVDGANIECTAITKDFVGIDTDEKERFLEIYTHYKATDDANDTIDISISVDRGENFISQKTITDTSGSGRRIAKTAWNALGKTCRISYSGCHFEIYGQKIGFNPARIR